MSQRHEADKIDVYFVLKFLQVHGLWLGEVEPALHTSVEEDAIYCWVGGGNASIEYEHPHTL